MFLCTHRKAKLLITESTETRLNTKVDWFQSTKTFLFAENSNLVASFLLLHLTTLNFGVDEVWVDWGYCKPDSISDELNMC